MGVPLRARAASPPPSAPQAPAVECDAPTGRAPRGARYSRVNGLKIHNQWLKIMRLAKIESLRKQIEVLSQSHERELDRKDAVIQMLDRDLEARAPASPLLPPAARPAPRPTRLTHRPPDACARAARPVPCRVATHRTRRSSTSWRCAAS